jgi:uncharacterized protein DUF2842
MSRGAAEGDAMRQSNRKLLGTVALIALLIVYPLAVIAIGGNWLAALPWWAVIGLVVVAAAIWLYPASRLVRWMAKPD